MEKRFQVFVSSTYTDLIEERKEVTQAILKCNCFPAGMELFPASNKTQWDIIKRVIEDSDFYLLIIAGRYGSLGKDDNGKKISYTEMEFDYALSLGKPIIVMMHKDPDSLSSKLVEKSTANIQKLIKFREKAATGRMVSFWENKDQLHSAVLDSLHKIMNDNPEAIGWIRANFIIKDTSTISKNNTQLLSHISKFKSITNDNDKLEYLETLYVCDLHDLFNNNEFIENYITLININKPSEIICKAIKLIPYACHLKRETIHLFKKIDINTIFQKQISNIHNCDKYLLAHIIQFMTKLEIYYENFPEKIFEILKSSQSQSILTKKCLSYLIEIYNSDLRGSISDFAMNELKNKKRILQVSDLCDLLITACFNEKNFYYVYEAFFNNDINIKEDIINSLFRNYDTDIYFENPKIQRMFFEMCDEVFTWNNDEIISKFLLYCLYTRTFDIFTIDEIFQKLNSFNDDVFYMFFCGICNETFSSDYYNLTKEEENRIINIIKERKHPRKAKLLEIFNKYINFIC